MSASCIFFQSLMFHALLLSCNIYCSGGSRAPGSSNANVLLSTWSRRSQVCVWAKDQTVPCFLNPDLRSSSSGTRISAPLQTTSA